jgi:hypothetical protein
LSEIWKKLGLQVIAFVGSARRQVGLHCVSQGELVAVDEEQNCLYHSSQKVQGELKREQAVSAHYEQVVPELQKHLISEWTEAFQDYLQGRSIKLVT